MRAWIPAGCVVWVLLFTPWLAAAQSGATAQSGAATQRAELVSLRDKVAHADTRIRVDALHRVWAIGLASKDVQVKLACRVCRRGDCQ